MQVTLPLALTLGYNHVARHSLGAYERRSTRLRFDKILHATAVPLYNFRTGLNSALHLDRYQSNDDWGAIVNTATQNQKILIDALQHLQIAIDLLDCAAAPEHIAAHADLAACQLQELIPPAHVARIRLRDSTDEGVGTL